MKRKRTAKKLNGSVGRDKEQNNTRIIKEYQKQDFLVKQQNKFFKNNFSQIPSQKYGTIY